MTTPFNEDYLIRSDAYAENMNSLVLPFLRKAEKSSILQTGDGHPLYSVCYEAENPLGTVLIVHGFTENALKYSELIWSLLHLRYSVIAYDQRGHGRSWRENGIPDPSVTHVDHFTEYVDDMKTICNHYSSMLPCPWYVFAHSMGGAVAALFLERNPGFFSAAVLSSPMIAPNLGGVPASLAKALGRCASFLGQKRNKPFFMKLYSGPEDFNTSCATDPSRFAWYDAIKSSRREFQNSVPSYQWSIESIHVTEQILSAGMPEKIDCPVLLFSADQDSSVLSGPQAELIARIRKGKLVFVPGSKHEIYRSRDEVLFPWWHHVILFFSDPSSYGMNEGGQPL